MLPWDPSGKIGPKKPLPDHVSIVEPKEEILPTTPISEQKGGKPEQPAMPQPVPTAWEVSACEQQEWTVHADSVELHTERVLPWRCDDESERENPCPSALLLAVFYSMGLGSLGQNLSDLEAFVWEGLNA